MATLSITVPDGQVARIVTAFDALIQPKGARTNGQFMSDCIKSWVTGIVAGYEAEIAADVARSVARAAVATEIP